MTKQGLMIAAALVAGWAFAGPAEAQQVRQGDRWVTMPRPGMSPQARPDPRRWGERIDGRWGAGARAPGGWAEYRRPERGQALAPYWLDGAFGVPDYLNWGLAAPAYGYRWVRYYDDAVLVDGQGVVWDTVQDVDWGDGAPDSVDADRYSDRYLRSGADYAPPPEADPIATVDPDLHYGDTFEYSDDGYVPPAAVAPPRVEVRSGACAGACDGVYYLQPNATTIIVQSGPAVTTTVVEEVTEETVTTRRVGRGARRR